MDACLQQFGHVLRRHGVRVSTAEVVDAATCAALPGMLVSRERLKSVLQASLVTTLRDRETFDSVFELFFHLVPIPEPHGTTGPVEEVQGGPGGGGDDLDDLALVDGTEGAAPIQSGSASETDMRQFFDPDVLREGRNLDDDADLADLAALSDEVSFSPSGATSRGSGMKVQLDVSRSRGVEAPGALSPATGQALDVTLSDDEEERLLSWLGTTGSATAREDLEDADVSGLLDRLPAHLSEHLRRLADLRRTTVPDHLDPVVLDDVEQRERDHLEESLRRLARRLEGGLSQRKRPHPAGRVDPTRTARRSMRYDGVPFDPVRVRQVRERPRVVVLADVSLSVRATARFTLHVVHGLQATLGHVRSFVFVDELSEVTGLFESHPLEHALGLAFGGDLVDPDASSDYGTVFEQLLAEHPHAVDRRTSVIVLGDGRSNGKDPGLEAFADIVRRARTTVWLSPEPSFSWRLGSCAMPAYAELCDHVEVVRDLHGLEQSSHVLARRP